MQPLLRRAAKRARTRARTAATRTIHSNVRLEPPSFATTFPTHLPNDFQPLTMVASWICATDHKILRFRLPSHCTNLSALGVPSGVKVRQRVAGELMDKSYSPISHATANGSVDLLVKSYPGGGLGKYLYDMKCGDTVDIKFKPEKLFQGQKYVANRWKKLLLIGNGTGIAPLYQLAQHIVQDPMDVTHIAMVSQHRSELLMQTELDAMVVDGKEKNSFQHLSILSQPPPSLSKDVYVSGRLELAHLTAMNLTGGGVQPTTEEERSGKHVIVCGTDDFLQTVCGPHVRIDVEGQIKKKKQQGPLLGLLKEAGFVKNNVSKL